MTAESEYPQKVWIILHYADHTIDYIAAEAISECEVQAREPLQHSGMVLKVGIERRTDLLPSEVQHGQED